jgi:purine nucleosidase
MDRKIGIDPKPGCPSGQYFAHYKTFNSLTGFHDMKRFIWLVSLLILALSSSRGDLLLQPSDRVAICGGGLSDNGAGIYLEDYLMMAQPSLRSMDVKQFTWLAGDPAGLLSKLQADLLPFKPTVVILSSGWASDPAVHEKDLTALIEALKKASVRLILVGSPPAVAASDFQGDLAKADAQNQVRSAEADVDKKVAAAEGAVYADVFGTMKEAMARAKSLQGDDYVKQAGADDAFQLAIAQAYIKAFGFDGNLGSLSIDYAAKTIETSPDQKAGPIQDNKFVVEATQYPFWFPGHGVGGTAPPPWPALKFLTFDQDLNRYILTVKNLPTATTKVYWGNLQQDFPSEELAKGIDLTDVMAAWHPFGNPDSSIDNGVRIQQGTDLDLGNAVNQGHPDPQADAKHEAAMQVVRDRCVPAKFNMGIQPLMTVAPQPPGPIPVILDTDLDSDVDDVGALALLNDFMDQGEANLLAVIHNTINTSQSSCGTIKAINDWYFHPDIPIGQYLGEHPKGITSKVDPAPPGPGAYHDPAVGGWSTYTQQVRKRFEPNFPDDDKMPAGVDVYRKALATAPDGQVVICSVGFMHNIQDLMLSEPDSVSPLSGMDLIRKKVRQLAIMANTNPADQYFLSKWPTPIVWTTYVGSGIGTGPSLIPTSENNPVRMCYDLANVLHTGRQSWDLTAAWVAVRGPGEMFDVVSGRPQYINDVTKTPTAPHPDECELTIKMPYEQASKVIGAELARSPKH